MEKDDLIIQKIECFTFNKCLLFGISCIDRILPLYKLFEQEIVSETDNYFNKFKNGYCELSQLLDKVIDLLINGNIDKNELHYLESKCLWYAPDTNFISSTLSVIAQNCAIGLSYLYKFILECNKNNIVYCRNKVIDTIDIISFYKKINENLLDLIIDTEYQIEETIISYINVLSDQINPRDLIGLREIDKVNHIVL